MYRNRKAHLALILALALSASGFSCQSTGNDPEAALASVAKGLDEAAHTIAIIQTTAINAESQHLLTEAQTRTLLEATTKANLAGHQAAAITRSISKLDPASRTNLLNILNPVIASVNELVANGTAGIKNEDTKQKIQLLLATLQATLNAVHLTLVTGGN